MNFPLRSTLLGFVILSLAACEPVAPIGASDDGGSPPSTLDAPPAPPADVADATGEAGTSRLPGCTLLDGTRCPLGADCPAGDGCNTARCEPDGGLRVSLIGCGGYCRNDADCIGGMRCFFSDPSSCDGAPGVCRPEISTTCSDPQPLCDCEGNTRSGCTYTRFRVRARSACAAPGGVPDAGAGACAGAQLTADRTRCLDAAGGGLPDTCCSGWLCDPRRAFCTDAMPTCPAGQQRTVRGLCWGPCVPSSLCDPRDAAPACYPDLVPGARSAMCPGVVYFGMPCAERCVACAATGPDGGPGAGNPAPCVCDGTSWRCPSDVGCGTVGESRWLGGPPPTCP